MNILPFAVNFTSVKTEPNKIITTNRKATHDYHILDRIEAGIVLKGSEVKSLRAGHANLKDSYARLLDGEVYLLKARISPYKHTAGYDSLDPERDRKLLLHKSEIRKLTRNVQIKGTTLIPLKMYFNSAGKVKIELGLAKGKRQYDKRAAIAKRDLKREIERIGKGKF